MASRNENNVEYFLHLRKELEYFGGEESDFEDNITEEEDDLSEEDCDEYSDESEKGDESEDEVPQVELEQAQAATVGREAYLRGKDGSKWSSKPAKSQGKPAPLTIMHFPSPTQAAMNVRSPLDAWSLLFTNEILDIIVTHTNEEISRYILSLSEDRRTTATYRSVDVIEIKAFIGLLYYAGLSGQNKSPLSEMWSTDFGMNLFVSTMSRNRFEFLSKVLRFDEKETRSERRKSDLLAPIRNIWELFLAQCRNNYNPSKNVTIDEQLLGFRGKFSARVYNKSKPARCGLKIVCMNDAKTFYMYNAIPYTGKVNCERNEKVLEYYVRVLSEPIYRTNRVITFDNWFTTINICEKMKKEYGLDVIGTIRKNKREIPPSFSKPASVGSFRYAYDHDKKITLVSFTPKKDKVVLLVSTIHKKSVTAPSGKPEIIEYYNATKGGVDTFDKIISSCTTARKVNRWSLRFFFGMLDQASINASVLFNLISSNESKMRMQFLKDLCLSLVRPHLEQRLSIETIHKPTRVSILQILGKSFEAPQFTTKMEKRKRCYLCSTKQDRKTKQCCSRCSKPVCDEHRVGFCRDCA